MKKAIITISLAAIALLAVMQTNKIKGNEYSVAAVVTSQTELVNERGEVWEYTDLPYSENTEVKITFLDNNTADLTDDIIVELAEN